MTDPDDALLDALASGLSIKDAAARFGLTQEEVRRLLKEEAERVASGDGLREQWALAQRRLLKMELAFHARAMDLMDPTSAVIALKSNERRFSLSGAGSAQASHLLFVMQQKAIEEAPTSTEQLALALDRLKYDKLWGGDPSKRPPEEKPKEED